MTLFLSFAERNDPNHTRDVIESLLKNGSPKTLEILCLIVREIGVAALHGSAACSYAASLPINKTVTPNNSASKKPQVSPTYQKTHHLSPTLEGLSRLGTVPLPKVIDYVEDVSDSEDDSASDIPSQSSESSDDEHVRLLRHYILLFFTQSCRTRKMTLKRNGRRFFLNKTFKLPKRIALHINSRRIRTSSKPL